MATKNKKTSKKTLSVKKANKMFEKLTPADKRVQIAKDCLAQIKAKRIIAECGTYIEMDEPICDVKEGDELQKILKNNKDVQCKVCGLGAMFYSAVHKFDNFKIEANHFDFNSNDISYIDEFDMRDFLRKYFSPRQMSLIESAFEASYFKDSKALYTKTLDEATYKASRFRDSRDIEYNQDEEALIAICKNIVLNSGTFKP